MTALTRGVALQIERNGDYAWPARQVADLLSAADLTHTSNEVSFMPGCQAQSDTMTFCSKPQYIETLEVMGVDLVELTGNHNLDFGASYALLSLDMYAQAGMRTFGGGQNAAEARRPLLITHNGNRLAFLGYNQFGPAYAWATEERPGAARFSKETVQADLALVRSQAVCIAVPRSQFVAMLSPWSPRLARQGGARPPPIRRTAVLHFLFGRKAGASFGVD